MHSGQGNGLLLDMMLASAGDDALSPCKMLLTKASTQPALTGFDRSQVASILEKKRLLHCHRPLSLAVACCPCFKRLEPKINKPS